MEEFGALLQTIDENKETLTYVDGEKHRNVVAKRIGKDCKSLAYEIQQEIGDTESVTLSLEHIKFFLPERLTVD